MEQKSTSNEIDLLELLAQFFAILKKNLVLTIGLPLLGAIVALGVSYNSKNLFESGMLIETKLLSENECKFLFDQLDKAGIVPDASPEVLQNLAGLRYEVIKNEENRSIDPKKPFDSKSVYMQVTAKVYHQEIFPALEKAILQFIDQSPSVVRHRQEQEKFYSEMIRKIDNEIAAMDQIKREINSKVQATYLNPSDLFANTVDLYEEKTAYELKLREIRNVHLVKGFDSLTIDAKMSKILVVLIGFAAGLFVLFLLLFIKFFVNYYTHYERSH